MNMRVAIGSDHAGFALKEAIKAFVAGEYGEVLDIGTHSSESVDYPDYAAAVGDAVREHRADRGIILCGSGVGASMAANRLPGIRAGLRRRCSKERVGSTPTGRIGRDECLTELQAFGAGGCGFESHPPYSTGR